MLLALALSFSTPALAEEPEARFSEKAGVVTGKALIPADEAEVRAALADPAELRRMSSDVSTVESTAIGNGCHRVRTVIDSVKNMEITSVRCPSTSGWTESLESSDGMEVYNVEWRLRTVEGGTEVTYQVESKLDLPIPEFVVTQSLLSSGRELFSNLWKLVQ